MRHIIWYIAKLTTATVWVDDMSMSSVNWLAMFRGVVETTPRNIASQLTELIDMSSTHTVTVVSLRVIFYKYNVQLF